MYCTNCGQKNRDNACFCNNCGNKLIVEDELEHIIIQIQKGNKKAFNELYRITQKYIRYVVFCKTEDSMLCEDIVQEIYISIYKNIGALNEPKCAWGWIKSIAVNTTINILKRESKYVLVSPEEIEFKNEEAKVEDCWVLPEEAAEKREVFEVLGKMIDDLPQMQRLVLLEYYFNGKKINEIAEECELSLGTIKSYLAKAKKKIEAKCKEWSEKTGVALYSVAATPVLYHVFQNEIENTVVKKMPMALKKTIKIFNNLKGKSVIKRYVAGISVMVVAGTGVTTYVYQDEYMVKRVVLQFEDACQNLDTDKIKGCFRDSDIYFLEKYNVYLDDVDFDECFIEIENIKIENNQANVRIMFQEECNQSLSKKEGCLRLIHEEKEWKLYLNEVNLEQIRLYGISSTISISDIIQRELIFNK